MQFWKEKLAGIYTEQAQNVIRVNREKEENRKELSKLEEEEIRLMEEINKYHSQGV
jgi:cell division protein FtsB